MTLRVLGAGENNGGELATGYTSTWVSVPASMGITVPATVVQALPRYNGGIALLENGWVYGWGSNEVGAVGDGTNADKPNGARTGTLTSIVQVAIAQAHGMALDSSGTVWVWGFGSFGQLGNGEGFPGLIAGEGAVKNPIEAVSPITVTLPHKAVWVAAGGATDFAIVDNAGVYEIYGWGKNARHMLGVSLPEVEIEIERENKETKEIEHVKVTREPENALEPVKGPTLPEGEEPIQVAAGQSHTIVLTRAGRLFGWGGNVDGQLGQPLEHVEYLVPVEIVMPEVPEPPHERLDTHAVLVTESLAATLAGHATTATIMTPGSSATLAMPASTASVTGRSTSETIAAHGADAALRDRGGEAVLAPHGATAALAGREAADALVGHATSEAVSPHGTTAAVGGKTATGAITPHDTEASVT